MSVKASYRDRDQSTTLWVIGFESVQAENVLRMWGLEGGCLDLVLVFALVSEPKCNQEQ